MEEDRWIENSDSGVLATGVEGLEGTRSHGHGQGHGEYPRGRSGQEETIAALQQVLISLVAKVSQLEARLPPAAAGSGRSPGEEGTPFGSPGGYREEAGGDEEMPFHLRLFRAQLPTFRVLFDPALVADPRVGEEHEWVGELLHAMLTRHIAGQLGAEQFREFSAPVFRRLIVLAAGLRYGAEAGEEAQRLQQLGWVASETVSLLLEDVRAFLDHSKELRPLHWYVCGHGAKWARDCMRARSELELEPPRPLPAPAGDLSVDTPVDGGVNYPASIGGFEAGSQSPSTPGYRQHSGSSGSSSSSESTTSSPEFFETYPRTGNAGGLSDSPAFQPSFSEFPSSGRPIPDSIIAFQQYNHPDQPHQPLHAAGDDIDSGYAQDISPSTATFGEASDYTPLPPSRTPSQFESIELVPSYPSLPEYPSGIPSHPLDFQAVSLHNPSFQTPQSPTASASLPYRSPPSPSHLSPAISPELLHITASPSAYRPSPGTPKIPIPSTPLVLGPMPNTPSESSETSPKTPKRSRPVDQTPSNVEGFSGPKRHHR